MDVREYLVRAQEADAIANASESPDNRRTWEGVAKQYRSLAKAIAEAQKTEGLRWPF